MQPRTPVGAVEALPGHERPCRRTASTSFVVDRAGDIGHRRGCPLISSLVPSRPEHPWRDLDAVHAAVRPLGTAAVFGCRSRPGLHEPASVRQSRLVVECVGAGALCFLGYGRPRQGAGVNVNALHESGLIEPGQWHGYDRATLSDSITSAPVDSHTPCLELFEPFERFACRPTSDATRIPAPSPAALRAPWRPHPTRLNAPPSAPAAAAPAV